jgi:hypothetical protein
MKVISLLVCSALLACGGTGNVYIPSDCNPTEAGASDSSVADVVTVDVVMADVVSDASDEDSSACDQPAGYLEPCLYWTCSPVQPCALPARDTCEQPIPGVPPLCTHSCLQDSDCVDPGHPNAVCLGADAGPPALNGNCFN